MGVTATDADVITEAIATQLSQNSSFRVMERAQMNQILKEQGFQNSGVCGGSECAVQMGKILSVDQILVGSVGLVGQTYTLNLRLVGVGTGEVLRSRMRSHAGTIDDVLTQLVPETVADLTNSAGNTGRAASKTEAPPVSRPSTSSKSHWGWWLAGGAVVAGGAAAALILNGPGSPGPTTPASSSQKYNSVTVAW